MMINRKHMAVCTAVAMTVSLTAGMTAFAGTDKNFSIDMTDTSEGSWNGIAMANDDTVNTGINIRSTASEDGTVVGFLYRGGAVEVVNKGDTWTEIKSGDVTGYIMNDYLTYGDEAKGLAEYYGVDGVETSWNDVNVFDNADANASIIHTADDGESYPVVQDDGHWIGVQVGADNMAYVSSEDVARVILVDEAVPLEGADTTAAAADYVAEETYTEDTSADYSSEDTYAEDTYTEETYADDSYSEDTYTDNSYTDESYTDESYTDNSYTEETAAADTTYEETYDDGSYTDSTTTDDTYTEDTYTDDTYVDDTTTDTGSTEYYDDGTTEDIETVDDAVEYTEDTASSGEEYTDDTVEYTEETTSTEAASSASAGDLDLMAAIIYCEAGNQSYEGMVAVGAVIMNRVASSSFPSTINDVIYQSGQFTPAYSGALASALASGVPSACYDAASAALAGENPVGSALYFNTGSGKGIQIGAHQFY